MAEELNSVSDRKKPQFGTRFLKNQDNVFQHNAWDDVEWNDELIQQAEEKLKLNSEIIVPVEKQEMYETEANMFWDKFYGIHQNRFFKDRHWLFTEFPELSFDSNCKKEGIQESSEASQINVFEVGCGVGNTVFPILETNRDSNVMVYCCDFSETAISLVQEHPDFDEKRCHPFVFDVSSDLWNLPFEENSLNYIILIFVLSAVHPDKMQFVIKQLVKYLKPGGQILFRDYGKYDMVELRFKPGQCLTNHFYVRGDGTRVYFFSEDEVHKLFASAGLEQTQLYSSKRLQVNRGKHLKMYRIWIQAKYKKL